MCKGLDPEGLRHTEELGEGQNGQSMGSYRDESEEVGRVLLRTKVAGGPRSCSQRYHLIEKQLLSEVNFVK